MAPALAQAAPRHADASALKSAPTTTITSTVDDTASPSSDLSIAQAFVTRLETAFASGVPAQVAALFRADGWYKEMLVLQWDHRARQGPAAIEDFLATDGKLSPTHTVRNFSVEEGNVTRLEGAYPGVEWVMAFVRFETDDGRGRGIVRLAREDDGEWKAHALFLGLDELKGHEPRVLERRIQGVEHGEHRGGLNWLQRRERSREFLDGEGPAVVIVGAGQAGLMLAYRLGMLDVPTLVLDRNDRIGDNWRKRYHSLVLHDPVQYDHFAGLPFPAHWPVYTPKDKLANWMEFYAEAMELNVWMQSEIAESSYDEAKGQWTLKVRRNGKGGEVRTLHPRHCVVATGHSGEPNRPRFPGEDVFKGPVVHSSEYTSGDAYPAGQSGKGRRAVVVGSNNSGQDISVNLVEHGWDVTQVQRSETYFMSTRSVTDILLKGLWSDPGPPTEDADLIFNSLPNPMHIPMQREVAKKIADFDRKTLDGLAKAGFKTGMGVDDAGFLMSYFKRGGGYYLGTSAEDYIIDGRIRVAQGREIARLTEKSVVLSDGTELQADLVVLATGYTNMKASAVRIFGEHAEKMKPVWGLDEEGELNTVWRPSGAKGLWAQAGNLALNREMSRRLALNIKARLEGLVEGE